MDEKVKGPKIYMENCTFSECHTAISGKSFDELHITGSSFKNNLHDIQIDAVNKLNIAGTTFSVPPQKSQDEKPRRKLFSGWTPPGKKD